MSKPLITEKKNYTEI